MTSFDNVNPNEPLRTIFSEEQIDFFRRELDQYDLDSILDKSLKDLMTSDDEPSVTELMQSVTPSKENSRDSSPGSADFSGP